ncbi:MAG: hypothetical protein RL095_4065 [Verrucomicrobiota bacterium]|jgi:hypothetical protein
MSVARSSFLALGAIGMFAVASWQQGALDRSATAAKLIDETPQQVASSEVMAASATLGAFRGLAANWLWLRSIRMQDEQRYHESYELGLWAVRLQPRCSAAASYLSWNMAYNISVALPSPKERWFWVRRGISILRDETLLWNPDDAKLYHQLGWTFQHKMGQNLDDANRYYKTEWSREMQALLGGGTPDWESFIDLPLSSGLLDARLRKENLGGLDLVLKASHLEWSALVEARRKGEDLPEAVKRLIKDPRWLEITRDFIDRGLKAPLAFDTLQQLLSPELDLLKALQSMPRQETGWQAWEDEFRRNGQLPRDFVQLLNSQIGPSRALVVNTYCDRFLRLRWMKQVYRLDPALCADIDRKYGILDWRNSDTHGIYWGEAGLRRGDPAQPDVQLTRLVGHGLMASFRAGRVVSYNSETMELYDWAPNLAVFDSCRRHLEDSAKDYDETQGQTFLTGLSNFYRESLAAFFLEGRKDKAESCLQELRRLNPGNPEYLVDVESFATKEANDNLNSMDEAQVMMNIRGVIRQSLYWRLLGEGKRGAAYQKQALDIHLNYSKQTGSGGFKKRRPLPPFETIFQEERDSLLKSQPAARKLIEAQP